MCRDNYKSETVLFLNPLMQFTLLIVIATSKGLSK